MTDDFTFGWDYRARAAELQDIAALDRLAAQVAPPSALRSYVRQHATHDGRRTVLGRLLNRPHAL